MYGLEAISAANGWAQAATGAAIVMMGLAALSFVISRIGKIIDLMENLGIRKEGPEDSVEEKEAQKILPDLPEKPLENLNDSLEYYKLLTAELGEEFSLLDFHKALHQSGDPHPHLTARTLREKGYLEAIGNGVFRWKQS